MGAQPSVKILYLSPSGQLGGAERSLLDLLAALRQARPAWMLELIVSAEGPLAARVRDLGVAVTLLKAPASTARLGDSGRGAAGVNGWQVKAAARLALGAGATAHYLMNLRAAIRDAAPDIVHTNGFKMHVLGAWSCPPKSALIWHIRDYVSTRPLMRHLLPLCARRCSIAIANSDHVAADVREVCGASLRVVRVYNGIDSARFSPNGPALDLDRMAALARPSAPTIRIGLLGTMARWKGHRVFLHAVARIPAEIPIRGYVIGGPIYETTGSEESLEDLRELAAGLGLQDRVGFTGFVEDPARAIRALDIVVHASTSAEPFGRVIAEAMASQRAVIVSRAGGAIELINEGEDALAFRPGDCDALTQQLVRLATDPQLRACIALRARQSAIARFDLESATGEIIRIYDSLSGPEATTDKHYMSHPDRHPVHSIRPTLKSL
jgi:glycosyltransferase involved in cell wall biosynthesis